MNDRINGPGMDASGTGGGDRMDLHYRQQLSALLDGALAPDEARFLLRRMQHDQELAECWERWQLAGEAMRGRAVALLPAGFATRVGVAIAGDAPPSIVARPARPWLRWGGGAALAASVAVVALLVARPAPDPASAAAGNGAIVATTPPPTVESSPPIRAATATQADAGQALAAAEVAGVSAAGGPRRVAQGMRPSRPGVRARSRRTPAVADPAQVEVASSSSSSHPFATGTPPVARPWPRAVLPQFGGSGVLTADTDFSASPSFYPFQPRLPDQAAQPDAVPAQPR